MSVGGGSSMGPRVKDLSPLLLLLDDVSSSSFQGVMGIVQGLRQERHKFLVIMTATSVTASFEAALRSCDAHELRLSPLEPSGTQQLVTDLLSGYVESSWIQDGLCTSNFTDILHRIAQGVPALVTRLCTFIRSNRIELSLSPSKMTESLSDADTLMKALCQQMIPLKESTLLMAQCAAVLGGRIRVGDLRGMLDTYESSRDCFELDLTQLIDENILQPCLQTKVAPSVVARLKDFSSKAAHRHRHTDTESDGHVLRMDDDDELLFRQGGLNAAAFAQTSASLPHLQRDWTQPLPHMHPHLHQDWAYPCEFCRICPGSGHRHDLT